MSCVIVMEKRSVLNQVSVCRATYQGCLYVCLLRVVYLFLVTVSVLTAVLFAIFDFITALLDITDSSSSSTSSPAHLFPPILPDLLYHLVSLMQITTEQVTLP